MSKRFTQVTQEIENLVNLWEFSGKLAVRLAVTLPLEHYRERGNISVRMKDTRGQSIFCKIELIKIENTSRGHKNKPSKYLILISPDTNRNKTKTRPLTETE